MRIDRQREAILSAERVRQVLDYDPATGKLTWKEKTRPKANRRVGQEAGGKHDKGYRHVSVDGYRYFVHRLVWLWMTGRWPVAQIDHRNGMTGDNRWNNLREATNGENNENLKRYANNSTGYPGIRWRPEMKKFQARLTKGGKTYNLGSFRSFDEAVAARQAAKKTHHLFEPKDRA